MAKSMEDALDDELHRMNNMDQDDLENIRRKRLEAMKGDQDKRKKWLAHGPRRAAGSAGREGVLQRDEREDMMVVHFYRNNWPCKVMDMHLDMLSKKHLETKFAKIDAEKSPFLTERLKIWMLPTLALISKEKVLDYVVGFDDLGGSDDFPTEHLQARARVEEHDQLRGRRRRGRTRGEARTRKPPRWWKSPTCGRAGEPRAGQRRRGLGLRGRLIRTSRVMRATAPTPLRGARCGAARECIIYGKTPGVSF